MLYTESFHNLFIKYILDKVTRVTMRLWDYLSLYDWEHSSWSFLSVNPFSFLIDFILILINNIFMADIPVRRMVTAFTEIQIR